jgi:23S rRNA (uracil1939-C5)-methyltransferase
VAGKVEDVIGGLVPADTVIVNPPRTGLESAVTAVLRAAPPRRLLYVSCDPATLARDLARLGATPDRLTLVRAYDMFPQTSHVETLVALDRDDGAGTARRDS